uniref:Cd4-specific ankyrin repeat protein n=1 Tax=Tetraselmis sp. GSL018 TaxID=582737 RepID=A0A061R0R8_9CHLO|mmetsp:Transcript_20338/g.48448  ORF Transcript_20338/g.48448 Transcript_20338/m.48448 type:complete len:178 (-) Transcript_20338:385-918(-)
MPPPKKNPTIELFEAVEEQAAEKVVRALNHGGDPNGVDEEERRFGITPVHVACQGAKTDILRLLVTYGGKVDTYTEYRRTPLSYAIQKNNRNMVKLLHDGCKVDINQTFIKGEECTPLILAAKLGHVEICKLLLKWGADLDAKDMHGKTAADYAKENKFDRLLAMLEEVAEKLKGQE